MLHSMKKEWALETQVSHATYRGLKADLGNPADHIQMRCFRHPTRGRMKMQIDGFLLNPGQIILLKRTRLCGKVNKGTEIRRAGFAHSFSYAQSWRFVQPYLALCQWTQ